MITFKDNYFILESKDLHYIFRLMENNHLEHLYIGPKLVDNDFSSLGNKITASAGSTIDYEYNGKKYQFDLLTLEYSTIGIGDFRIQPFEFKMPDGSFVADFLYSKHEIIDGIIIPIGLPHGRETDDVKTLIIETIDQVNNVKLELIYSVFYNTNTFTRKYRLTNLNNKKLEIRKMMSMMLDLNNSDYNLTTFGGGWIKETHKTVKPLYFGTYVNESTTGASSNRHNPGFIISNKETHEDYGFCLGVNLIYSGNHYGAVSVSNHGLTRIMIGINPHCFSYDLEKNESFMTPEAVISASINGFNGLSKNLHDFVNNNIVPVNFQKQLRPIVINSWEAFDFDFSERKIVKLAKDAKKLGIEMLVLDDGWFGKRDNDKAGLGDYDINKKKLKRGLNHLAKRVHKIGLQFGLWFEPEMVNEESNLYKNNPEYAVTIKGRKPLLGRNQLVLDLCNKRVREYIISNVSKILAENDIEYVKWDMNRHITDMYSSSLVNQGNFYHEYIKGLYEILDALVNKFPHVLFESCSSGGNRFDLGMLYYMPQVWASDNTDPIERLSIQEGLTYLYPLSTISCHVSMAPHAQTLRKTELATRFNVASFGVLGYELNFKHLSKAELKEVKRDVEFYKTNRSTMQFGDFYRFNETESYLKTWQTADEDKNVLGRFQLTVPASPNLDIIKFKKVNENDIYNVYSYNQNINITRFGHLIYHAQPKWLPGKLNAESFLVRLVSKYFMMPNAKEEYKVSGNILKMGLPIKQQFMGTWYNSETRILGDYGSQIYIAKKGEK